jgi:cell division protein ZapE
MTPWERYQLDLGHEDFSTDPAQQQAVGYTQALYERLVNGDAGGRSFFSQLSKSFNKSKKEPVKGLYFWGGVGRGKTYLADAFYDCLPFPEKRRVHFHRFMQMIHHELKQIREQENPLWLIADKIASDTRVVCFDELHVTDITDAMLLGGLLKALFERGVVLVATSNEAPDQLYRDGLQRERFLPAIALLKKYTHVVQVDSGIDYRLRFLEQAEIYHCPLDQRAECMLHDNFTHIAPNAGRDKEELDIEGRTIQTECCADGVVWFDFNQLCDGPRGPADYIEIARQYQTVLLANIPQMDENDNDQVKRFMTLVDEFYDRNVKLIVTAVAQPEELYRGSRYAREFQRTVSRLMEMRTYEYLAKPHLP